jgi:Fe-S oxidoreductase/FAD/FMN-containing dehydrogenase
MIGNNSCGVHSVIAGRTAENVCELDVLTYDGLRMRVGPTSDEAFDAIVRAGGRRAEIYRRLRALRDRYATLVRERYPHIPRRVSGYNLDELLPERGFDVARALVGSEGTCVTVLEATVRLVDSPRFRSLLVLGYPDVYLAGDHVADVMQFEPIGCEGLDEGLVIGMKKKGLHPEDVELLPDGKGWLLVEFGGDSKQESDARAKKLMDALRGKKNAPSMKLFDDANEEKTIWHVRESGLGATARIPGDPPAWPGWEDAAVPPDRMGDYMRDFRALLDRYGYHAALYGHFGQGCVHCRISFDLETRDGIEQFHSFTRDAADLVVGYGGSLSGEHGDGQSRAELLPKMFGPELVDAFREFKSIWDPGNRMNPGKVVDARRNTDDLRLMRRDEVPHLQTHFRFADDEGEFAHAVNRCVGVGECRREHGGTMCPSYMVTREEEHSTRGRSRALFEMVRGDVIDDGWKSADVKEALDLCLACKGCRTDCPVNVDMATYKAEFLSHYYEGRLRPRTAYAFGLIDVWARIASRVPRVVNFVAHAPLLRRIARWVVGMPAEREIPRFAHRTFRDWFALRPERGVGAREVILWPDTFNNYFHPETAAAAVEVLEAAGFRVVLPPRVLCCGRPLYDFGMLERAKRYLRDVIDALAPHIDAGVPIVGLEPSCVAVFRDELANLLGGDPRAERLAKQTWFWSEFLEKYAKDFVPPRIAATAIVQGHCHHRAVMKFDDEVSVMKRLGLDVSVLDSGCCGMAGSFGFEKDHVDVSIAAGERVLLPAVRRAANETLVIADGFSCREQIAQRTERRALHLAEVMQMSVRGASPGAFPERSVPSLPNRPLPALRMVVASGIACIAAGVFLRAG